MNATMLMLAAMMIACPYPHICNLMVVPTAAPPVLHSREAEGHARYLSEMSGVPP